MNAFLQESYQKASTSLEANSLSWLSERKRTALAKWQAEAQLPDRKVEDWRYTNLRAIEEFKNFTVSKVAAQAALSAPKLGVLNDITLQFVDGVIDAESLSSVVSELPAGLVINKFSSLSVEQKQLIDTKLDTLSNTEKTFFSSLNTASFDDALFIQVAEKAVIDRPLRLFYQNTGQTLSSPRVLLISGELSEFTLIEQFYGEDVDSPQNFTNAVTEIFIGPSSRVHHYRIQEENQKDIHVGGFHVELQRSSYFNSFQLAFGTSLTRVDIDVHHNGEGAESHLNGIYLPGQDEHIDYHTTLEHTAARCTSSENFRGIINGNGRAVFNGRIHIHKDAQKTLAQLSNKNLLTSNKAEVDTKPELEIYADDVQCAHGATVAQLDKQSLHYLRTRGVSEEKARVILSFGFLNELLNQLSHDDIANYLRPILAKEFSVDASLLEQMLSS